MKIVSLESENVKRLKAVRIKPDGSLVQITGKNGAGKTSVLDSITMALAGGSTIPEKPIREGEEKAKVVVDLGDIKVTRTWTANDKAYFAVETKEGAKYPSPQALLDKLTGRLSFDPLAFARMEAKRQAETLRQLVGIDFSMLDQKRKELYEERQLINRTIRDIEGRLRNMPEVESPDEEIDIVALSRLYTDAVNHQKENAEKRHKVEEIRRYIAELKADIEALEKELEIKKASLAEVEKDGSELRREVAVLKDPDIPGMSGKLQTAEATNKLVRQKKERSETQAELDCSRQDVDLLSEKILEIDEEKQKALSEAKFPITGLSFDENGVTYNGIPFSQASSAEQLRISVAMGLALNPKIRVILIRDGSLLDADNMRIIGEMAEANDSQVWVERVSDGGKVGVVIEDGEVVEK